MVTMCCRSSIAKPEPVGGAAAAPSRPAPTPRPGARSAAAVDQVGRHRRGGRRRGRRRRRRRRPALVAAGHDAAGETAGDRGDRHHRERRPAAARRQPVASPRRPPGPAPPAAAPVRVEVRRDEPTGRGVRRGRLVLSWRAPHVRSGQPRRTRASTPAAAAMREDQPEADEPGRDVVPFGGVADRACRCPRRRRAARRCVPASW